MFIIGLCGKAGSGKSTIANGLAYRLAQTGKTIAVIPFAKPVKEIAELFGWDGKKDERGRKLLQMIGTEVGREYNPNLWIEKLQKSMSKLPNNSIVIVDDVRFDNEVEFILEHDGKVCLINRNVKEKLNHISEHGINYSNHDIYIVDNNDNINDAINYIVDLIYYSLELT